MRLLLAIVLVGLAACGDPAVELPPGPAITVAYTAACDPALHQHLVTLEGYLHLFPTLLTCYPGGEAPSARSS